MTNVNEQEFDMPSTGIIRGTVVATKYRSSGGLFAYLETDENTKVKFFVPFSMSSGFRFFKSVPAGTQVEVEIDKYLLRYERI